MDTVLSKNFVRIFDIVDRLFKNGFIVYGGVIRDLIIPKKKNMPNDIDVYYESLNSVFDIINNEFCNDYLVEPINFDSNYNQAHTSVQLIDSEDNFSITIDISEKKNIGNKLDFDINGIYMKNKNTYKLPDSLTSIPLSELISKIESKKFSIISTYKPPIYERSTCVVNIQAHSLALIEYLKIMSRTCKMLKRGWKLYKQDLNDIFEPCLIEKIDERKTAMNKNKCNFCFKSIDTYGIKMLCCENMSCFDCILSWVKDNFFNTHIDCKFCRGDPFGWKTSSNNFNKDNESLEHDIYL